MQNKSEFVNLNKWESEFFAKNIWTLNDFNIIKVDDLNKFTFISSKVPANNYCKINQLTELGFSYVEGEVTLTKVINSTKDECSCEFSKATELDLPILGRIAREAFEFTRFREPWFTKNQKENFYELWLKKSVYGIFDDICLMVKQENKIKGFITLKKYNEKLKIGLLAVSKKYHGQGVGRTLMTIAEMYAIENDCREVQVSTQLANNSAINLYIKSDYILNNVSYWYYRENKNC